MTNKFFTTLLLALLATVAVQAQPFCDSYGSGPGFPSDPACEASICITDPFCCNTGWDSICATAASSNPACAGCVGAYAFCDLIQVSAGFPANPACEAAICNYDAFCCSVRWDGLCAAAAAGNPDCASCLLNNTDCSSMTTITACSSYYWSVSGMTYYNSGIYTFDESCGTHTLNLTIALGTQTSLSGTVDVCVGGVIYLVATGGNTYQWSGPGGYTNTGGSITRSGAMTVMSGTYTVTITNNECSVVRSIDVTVHLKPVATITGVTPVCSGGTISLSAPAGAISYAWSGPGGFTATGQNMMRMNATTAMTGTYKVTVTGTGGCTATASRSVTVNAPTAATITGATGFCSNGSVTLNCTTAGVSYQWGGPGGFSFSGATMTRTPAVAGTYTVTVQNAAGCISTASRTVSVTNAPTVSIQNNSNCTRIWLIASGGNSYQWSGPEYFSSVGSTVLRNPASYCMYGTYTVTVTGSGGCTASASITLNPCGANASTAFIIEDPCSGATKNEGMQMYQSLQAYPNPAQSVSTLSFTPLAQEEAKLSVFNIQGVEIANLFTGVAEAGTTYQLPFDVADLPNGVYFAVLQYANGATEHTRIMVVK